ncbi:hypothetical protein HPB52_010751 [Rhipicephalus sanguineus]|uniref:Uncharacterized protein n=1 Tax=Rhipicephalus sanguineus TaxID=34632 RepID=A0A9D4PIJ7_RHISA|nr:hypothetical protein HPB52_010751 [Rhipicephalus sanguineus]
MSAEQADIFQLVEGRRRRRKNTKWASTPKTPFNNPASGDTCALSPKPPQKTSPPVSKWTPEPTVRMNPDDYVIVLKPRITVALKSLSTSKGPLPLHGHLKLTGDVCLGVISVHNLETSASLKHNVQWRGGELVYARKLGNPNVAVLRFAGRSTRQCQRATNCGTLGHRSDICPNPVNERCGLCGQNGGADTEEMVPHECNPMCIVCGGPHLTSSLECTGKFTKLQQPGPRTSGSPTKPKRQPTGKAPTPGKTATATLPPGAAESPALSAPSGGAARDQDKVGSWAETLPKHWNSGGSSPYCELKTKH